MLSRARRYPLQPASAAAILGTDWLLHSLSSFFELATLGPAAVWGSIFCGIVVFLVENVSLPQSTTAALAKGMLAAGVVSMPGPILGTSIALAALAWRVGLYFAARFDRSRR